MNRSIPPHRLWLRGAVCLVVAVSAVATTAQPAAAWNPLTRTNCAEVTFSGPAVEVVVHTAELNGSFGDVLNMLNGVYDVNNQINEVGATSARVFGSVTNYSLSTDPFVFGQWYGETTPTIHVGFTPTLSNPDAHGSTQLGPITRPACTYHEAHVALLDETNYDWDFDTPGDGYHRALSYDRTSYDSWFRQTYLHELLHAFGLDHTDDVYAMTNYGNRPWINMGSDPYRDDAVAPLPDDAAGLRHLYPQPGADHAEVALTNTWYDPTDVTNGAAAGDLLCTPSLGTAFKTDLFSVTACATGGPQSGDDEVCAGDILRTRFTLANYSTGSITYTVRLFFSTDLQHSWNDIISPSTSNGWQAGEISDLKSVSWEVPAALYATNPPSAPTLTAEYHPIVRITGTTSSNESISSWIPLTDSVYAPSSAACRTRNPA